MQYCSDGRFPFLFLYSLALWMLRRKTRLASALLWELLALLLTSVVGVQSRILRPLLDLLLLTRTPLCFDKFALTTDVCCEPVFTLWSFLPFESIANFSPLIVTVFDSFPIFAVLDKLVIFLSSCLLPAEDFVFLSLFDEVLYDSPAITTTLFSP